MDVWGFLRGKLPSYSDLHNCFQDGCLLHFGSISNIETQTGKIAVVEIWRGDNCLRWKISRKVEIFILCIQIFEVMIVVVV